MTVIQFSETAVPRSKQRASDALKKAKLAQKSE